MSVFLLDILYRYQVRISPITFFYLKEYRLCLAQSLFLSVSEEDDVTEKVKWKLKRRTWKSYNRALHEAWCYVKAPAVNKPGFQFLGLSLARV